MLKLRKIKLKVLLLEGAIYRVHIIVLQSIFWYFFYGITNGTWNWNLSIGSSLAWNLVNIILYYNYHYWFARAIKIGDRKVD